MTAKEMIETAESVVNGERQLAYGHPAKNHGCTAILWSAYLARKYDLPITLDTDDVCMLNILQKVSRQANARKDDNLVDIIGYSLNAAMCGEVENKNERTNDE